MTATAGEDLGTQSRLKRGFDVVVAAFALLLSAPLMALIAVAIKLSSRGPVFFHSPRIGRGGEQFEMFKFRSMVRDADERWPELRERTEQTGARLKVEEDPRVTRVGRVLRRWYLDELPQLLNVLRGDMSMVGPRPLVPAEDALITGPGRRRLELRPGITGEWQTLGEPRVPLPEMAELDVDYGKNWSLGKDLGILARTIPCMLKGDGR